MVTQQDVFDLLRRCGVKSTDTVTVHAALRSVGPIANGADGLIDALKSYLYEGLLLVPTHTWATVTPENPCFDVRKTQPCIGALAQAAAFRPDGVRSLHPTHSMAAFGKGAEAYIAGEEKSGTPTPVGGALSRLYEKGGKVILLGVGQERNTYLHAVDERLGIKNRLADEGFDVTVTDRAGNTFVNKGYRPHLTRGLPEGVPGCSEFFINFDRAFEACGAVQKDRLGDAPVLVCDAVKMTDQMAKIWSRADCDMCLCQMDIPQSWYA